jgi:lysophospholipase L1-like esterase
MVICCKNDPEIINETNPVDETDPIALDLSLVRYLAIGDSYTVGEGIETTQSWPSQLKRKLLEEGVEEVEGTVGAALFLGKISRGVIRLDNTLITT